MHALHCYALPILYTANTNVRCCDDELVLSLYLLSALFFLICSSSICLTWAWLSGKCLPDALGRVTSIHQSKYQALVNWLECACHLSHSVSLVLIWGKVVHGLPLICPVGSRPAGQGRQICDTRTATRTLTLKWLIYMYLTDACQAAYSIWLAITKHLPYTFQAGPKEEPSN